MSDELTTEFEKGEAGASSTFPIQAGSLKKGDFAILKGKPCKVMEIRTAKTGKHGHAKATITGIDIFTGKKCEDSCPTSHNIDAPVVTRKEYTLVDIQNDGFVSLLTEDGDTKDDLSLPTEADFVELVGKIKVAFEGGKEVTINVVSAMGTEKIIDYREQ